MEEKIKKLAAITMAMQKYRKTQQMLVAMMESDSEEEELFLGLVLIEKFNRCRPNLRRPARQEGYVENVVSHYLSDEFQQHFRLSASTATNLENLISPLLIRDGLIGRTTIPPRKQILSVIWLLATPDSYRSIGQQFGMSKSTLHHCFRRVYKALNEIAPKIICWPNNSEKLIIKDKYQRKSGLPDIVGAIDGCQVDIDAPEDQPAAYRTGKKRYAIQMQAVCNSDLLFLDVFAGYPGSVHDARVFKNSPLFRDANLMLDDNEYIIGDKAYPLLLWCIPPYKNYGTLTPAEVHFNRILSLARQTIERAFCLLKGRFRLLKHLSMLRTDEIAPTILASAVLHNLCLEGLGEPENMLQQYISEGHERESGQIEDAYEDEPSEAAVSKRDYLKNLIFFRN